MKHCIVCGGKIDRDYAKGMCYTCYKKDWQRRRQEASTPKWKGRD